MLFHEVIHCCPGCQNHGAKFKAIAGHVNKAYGTHVEVRKGGSRQGTVSADDRARAEGLVGHDVVINGRKFTFTGLNSRPKNCCDLEDESGNRYFCNIATLLSCVC